VSVLRSDTSTESQSTNDSHRTALLSGRDITIVMPARDAAETIERAILSVLAQSSPAWRLIIVDDGSLDGTFGIASQMLHSDERAEIVRLNGAGVAAARNAGVSAANTEFVAFLDSDDALHPEYLVEMRDFITEHPGYDIYHPDLAVVAESGSSYRFTGVDEAIEYKMGDLIEQCVIAVGGACVRRALLEEMCGFRPEIHCEDYDLWLRAFSTGATALYLPRVLYTYHQAHAGRRSADVIAGLEGYAMAVRDLVSAGALASGLQQRADEVLDRRRQQIAEMLVRTQLANQEAEFLGRLKPITGTHLAGAIFRSFRATYAIRSAMVVRGVSRSIDNALRR